MDEAVAEAVVVAAVAAVAGVGEEAGAGAEDSSPLTLVVEVVTRTAAVDEEAGSNDRVVEEEAEEVVAEVSHRMAGSSK